jgi:hypothetical protein
MIYRVKPVRELVSAFLNYVKELALVLLYTIIVLLFLWFLASGGSGPACVFLAGCG